MSAPQAKPSPQPQRDPIPAFASAVLALYASALHDVRFPDLDLTRLQSAHDAALAAQLALEQAEERLQAAREQLQSQLDALGSCSTRALAYATVFAQGDAQLQQQITQIGAQPATPGELGREPKKRKRRAKSESDAQLFAAADVPKLQAAEPAEPRAAEHAA